MNVRDADRYSTTLIFCRTMIIVYCCCGKRFACLTSSTFKVVLCGVPWKSWSQRRWLQVSEVSFALRLTTACNSEDEKNEDGVQKNSKRDMVAGVSALHVLAQTVGRRPLRMVTEKGFLDESIWTSDFRAISWLQTLSITFCNFLLLRSETIWHLWEDNHNTATRRPEGYMECLKGFTPPQPSTSRPFRWSIVTSIWLLSRENFGWFLRAPGELCQLCTQCSVLKRSKTYGFLGQKMCWRLLQSKRMQESKDVKRQAGSQSAAQVGEGQRAYHCWGGRRDISGGANLCDGWQCSVSLRNLIIPRNGEMMWNVQHLAHARLLSFLCLYQFRLMWWIDFHDVSMISSMIFHVLIDHW